MKKVDCIIVGAGPAGVFCATTLADHGMECVLLEKRNAIQGKVCGGGVSRYGVRVLERVGFPVIELLRQGVKIERDIRLNHGQVTISTDWKEEAHEAAFAVGIHRDVLDGIFLQCAMNHGVTVQFDCRVRRIEHSDGFYLADEYAATDIVNASGAAGCLMPSKGLPAGISAIYKSERGPNNAFLFDYNEPYSDGYAWVFHIGQDLWNAGVWSRHPNGGLKARFQQFEQVRLKEILDYNAVCVRPPRGAVIGSGDETLHSEEHAYTCGDAARTASMANGEGIPQAILSGIRTAQVILENRGRR